MKKTLLLTILLIFLASIAFPQKSSREFDLMINKVTMGTKYENVVRRLGKPSNTLTKTYSKAESCLADAMTVYTMQYDGLSLVLISLGKKKPIALEIAVTSNKWLVSGVRIGDSQEMVKRRLGEPASADVKGATTSYYYDAKLGNSGIAFTFENDGLIKIEQGNLIC